MANKTTKFFALLALFGIIISVVWTALLIFFWETKEKTITQEELQNLVDSSQVEITSTWTTK